MSEFLSMPNENMDLFVTITKQGSHYTAQILRRHKQKKEQQSELFQTAEPLTRMLLEQLLESFGFHQRDVFDALDIEEGESATIKHPLW